MKQHSNNRGSALLMSLLVSLFLISGLLCYSWYNSVRNRENIQELSRHEALNYADSCMKSALTWLRSPDGSVLSPGGAITLPSAGPASFPATFAKGRCEVSLVRGDPALGQDLNIISAVATGYYQLPRSTQTAVVKAVIRFTSVTQYMLAVGNLLHIGAGSDITDGVVYAPDLVFDGAVTIGAAYYYRTVSPLPVGVTFTLPSLASPVNYAQQLPSPLNVAMLNISIRNLYINRNTALFVPQTFTGTISAPADSKYVYFYDGDVDIGQPGPGGGVTINGVFVIYATGDIRIHNSIRHNPGCWAGFLSEKAIYLKADAPDDLKLNGNFIANAGMLADVPTPARSGGNCRLEINGGIVGMSSPNFGNVWTSAAGCTRTYSYESCSDPHLYLPNLSTILEYQVTKGRAAPLSKTTQLPSMN
jgi:hypothetical protein